MATLLKIDYLDENTDNEYSGSIWRVETVNVNFNNQNAIFDVGGYKSKNAISKHKAKIGNKTFYVGNAWFDQFVKNVKKDGLDDACYSYATGSYPNSDQSPGINDTGSLPFFYNATVLTGSDARID